MTSPIRGFLSANRFTLFLVLASVLSWASDTKKTTAPAPAPTPAAHPAAAPAQHPAAPGAPNTARPGTTPTNTVRPGTTNTVHPGSTNPTTVHPTPGGPAIGRTPTNPRVGAQPTTTTATAPHTFQPGANSSYKGTPVKGGGTVYHDAATNRTVRTDAAGHPTQIIAPRGMAGSMTINRTGYGRVVQTGAPGSRVVNYAPHRGFVERPLAGRPGYYSRTYVYGEHRYAVVYREYRYRGYGYYRYVPAYYYGPRFYGWAYNPWPAPVYYAWGGPIGAPWIYAYPAYYTPAPVYYSPDVWLTDYMLAQNLQAAYQAQQGAPDQSETASAAPSAPITPEVRAAIADEVKQQIAQEQAAAQAPAGEAPAGQNLAPADGPGGEAAPPAMNLKFFVVSSPLDVAVDGQPCSLTPGDIIERRAKEPDASGNVRVEVVSSKAGDCAAESDLNVKMADLQDMHNQFRENIDAGLKVMADNDANSKGLPKAPTGDVRNVSEGTCQAAPDADSALLAQDSEATRLEAQVVQN